MRKYKGDLEGFDEEIVEWMLDEQERQGNKRDVSVFEKDRFAGRKSGGIIWEDTIEKSKFCIDVIEDMNFDVFYERYPKKQPRNKSIYWVTEWSEILKKPSFKMAKKIKL